MKKMTIFVVSVMLVFLGFGFSTNTAICFMVSASSAQEGGVPAETAARMAADEDLQNQIDALGVVEIINELCNLYELIYHML